MEIFNISSIQFWKSNSVSSFLQDKWNSIQIFQAKVPCLHPKTIVFVETKTWKHVVSTYSISISRSPFRMAPAEFCSRPCRKYESSCSFHWAELLRTMSVGLPRFVFCWLPRCFCFLYMEATPTSEVTWKKLGEGRVNGFDNLTVGSTQDYIFRIEKIPTPKIPKPKLCCLFGILGARLKVDPNPIIPGSGHCKKMLFWSPWMVWLSTFSGTWTLTQPGVCDACSKTQRQWVSFLEWFHGQIVHPRKRTWQWKTNHLKMHLLQMVIFYCYRKTPTESYPSERNLTRPEEKKKGKTDNTLNNALIP